MPIQTFGFNLVQNVRTLVVGASSSVQHVCIHNHDHNQNKEIFIGGPDVTVANGMHAVATQTGVVQLMPGDELYAITPETEINLRVLVVK